MKQNKEYNIAFKHLENNISHLFQFSAGDAFFASFNNPEVSGGELNIEVDLLKKNDMIILSFSAGGYLRTTCDICLEEVALPVYQENTVTLKYDKSQLDDYAETDYINPADNFINIAQYIYEFAVLGLPLKKMHPVNEDGKSTCNDSAIKKYNDIVINRENK